MQTASEDKKWVICPFCHKPNPAGRELCQYCWSSKMQSEKILTTAEMEAALLQWKSRQKKQRLKKAMLFSSIGLVVLVLVVMFILFTGTDTFFKPDIKLNSNSDLSNSLMFHQNQERTGVSGVSEKLPEGNILWTFSAEKGIHSSAAIVGGTVYFGSRDYNLYALDAADGTLKWSFKTSSWVESSPAVEDSVVYFGSNDGYLYAVNAETGQNIWSYKTAYAVKSSPAICGDIIYFGSDDGYLYALNKHTGKRIWRYNTKKLMQSSPVVANGIVYVCSGSALYTLDAYSGRFRMYFKTYYPTDSSPVISGTTVYFGNSDGLLFAVNGNSRSWPWEYEIRKWWFNFYLWRLAPEPSPQSGSLWGLDLGNTVRSSPCLINNILYVGVDNKMIAVDTINQKIIWKYETGDLLESSPAATTGTIYFGGGDGNIYALDSVTGKQIWSLKTGDKVSASPVLVNGILYIGSEDGTFYAIK